MTKEEIKRIFRDFNIGYRKLDYWGKRQYQTSFKTKKVKAMIDEVLENPVKFITTENTMQQALSKVVIMLNIKNIYYEEEPINLDNLNGYYYSGIVWSTDE